LAPRLTPGVADGGGAGRRLAVDPIDAALVISERLPWPTLSVAVATTYELLGPVIRDREAAQGLHTRIVETDPQHVRAMDSIRAAVWLDAHGASRDVVAGLMATWRHSVHAA